MKFSISTLVSLLAFIQLSKAAIDYTDHKLLRFDITNDTEVTTINNYIRKNNVDAWNYVRIGKVDLRLTPKQFKTIKKDLSIKHKVLSDNIQKLFNEEKTSSNGRVANAEFKDSYHSYGEITQWLEKIACSSKGAATTFSIGPSYESRQIKGITFRKPGASPKKVILYQGGVHAREWISTATLVYLIDAFSKYTTDPALNTLLDTFEYSFIPVLNPDGYEYSISDDRLWRVNRQPNENCFGTDLNRNWDYEWKSNSFCYEGYPGPSAFSAPEARALADYITSKGNIINYIDFHAYGQLFMHPYAYSCTAQSVDNADQDSVAKAGNAALKAVNGRTYEQGTICKTIYQAFGISVDWAYAVGKVKYPYAIELPDTGEHGIILPESFIPSVGAEILAAIKVIGKSIKAKESL